MWNNSLTAMMGPGTSAARILRFGAFEFDPRAGELRKFGLRLKLREQPVKILALLLKNPGEVVLREEIRACLWPDNTAGEFDHGINVAVQKLRDALGEAADAPRFVETVARRGYRFIGEVEPVESPQFPENGVKNDVPLPVAAPSDAPAVPVPAAELPRRRPALLWIATGAVLIALAFIAGEHLRGGSAGGAVIRFSILPPTGTLFGGLPGPVVSPDGRRLVFVTTSSNGYRMWLRSLAVPDATPLAGAEGGSLPFWSPDGKSVAFFTTDGKLKRIDLDGPVGPSSARIVCDAPESASGTWGSQGIILFATETGVLFRVADTGGTPVTIGGSVQGGPAQVYRYPSFLPDGRNFLFLANLSPPVTSHFAIRVGSLDSNESKPIVDTDSNAVYVNRRLLYVRGNTLVAQPFDVGRLATIGSPVPLADPIAVYGGFGNFSASEDGPLVYATAPESFIELVWFDRDGRRLGPFGPPLNPGLVLSYPSLSPDGKSLAIDRIEGNNADVWVYNVASGAAQRLTFDSAKEVAPLWSPDGKSIVFASSRRGHFDIYRKAADGSGAEELLLADEDYKYPTSFSPDGRFLLFRRRSDKEPHESVWVLPLAPPGRPFSLLEHPVNEGFGEFSPDGRWVVYTSSESARYQVYVAPFSESGPVDATRQISLAEGGSPQWSRDGKEIFYCSRQKLKATTVNSSGHAIEVGQERDLIDAGVSILGYCISPGGRFLLKLRSHEVAVRPLTVVQNWMSISPGSR